jgi:SAM-dependent methyltransferase
MTEKQLAVFFEVHADLPREAPGSRGTTQIAFSCIEDLPPRPSVLDVGCGPGAQTIDLQKLSGGTVHAVDTHQPFLDRLRDSAAREGLSASVIPVRADMKQLPFPPASFDLLWAEGSIYIIGVEEGLRRWKPLLKPDATVAFSELTWLFEEPPAQPRAFWQRAYPGMETAEGNERRIEAAGFEMRGSFLLPETDWWDSYYTPIEAKLPELRDKYREEPDALAVLHEQQEEIDLYRQFSDHYGYVFYFAKPRGTAAAGA